jgi:hypothetical protein
MNKKLKVGDRARYINNFGQPEQVWTGTEWRITNIYPCTITGVGKKNGRRVYDCIVDGSPSSNWGYETQFTPYEGAL